MDWLFPPFPGWALCSSPLLLDISQGLIALPHAPAISEHSLTPAPDRERKILHLIAVRALDKLSKQFLRKALLCRGPCWLLALS